MPTDREETAAEVDLWIMRHGKSDWLQGVSDFDRPLNDRGERQARQMGAWLAGLERRPGQVLVSPARRARQTADIVVARLAPRPAVSEREALYLASRDRLVREIQVALDEGACRLLVIGHNPGLDALVTWLSDSPVSRTPRGKLMTTSAIAHFRLATGRLRPGGGRLLALIRPDKPGPGERNAGA